MGNENHQDHPRIVNITKSNELMDMDVELIEKRDTFYEINKNHLHELWDNVTSKSLIYVSIVFLVYIVLVSLTILHETYQVAIHIYRNVHLMLVTQNYGDVSGNNLWRTVKICCCTKPPLKYNQICLEKLK